MSFQKKLDACILKNNSLLSVGLDSNHHKLPPGCDQFSFNKAIIDATCNLVCAYKPNTAFYEAQGLVGIEALKKTCDYIRHKYPEIPIILDAKRGDIGSTNTGYAEYAFDYLGADAITLHPYLGSEALETFLNRKDKGCIILCRTSSPQSGELQDQLVGGIPLYQYVAKRVSNVWNANGNCMLVVGATYPEELSEVRKIVGDMTLLVPGVGAQGADIEKTVIAGINSKKMGMIINSSRGIIFASSGNDFAEAARLEATSLRNQINSYR